MVSQVETAQVSQTLSAVRLMIARGKFHHVPITDGSELVGMISSRDLVQVYRHIASNRDAGKEAASPEEPSIAETMTKELVTMRSDENIEKAINILADGGVHSILILSPEEKLAGIVTNIDLLEYLFA
jgi:CBS domain-containing protein